MQHGVVLVVLAAPAGQQEVQWVHLVNRVKPLSWLGAAATASRVPTAGAATATFDESALQHVLLFKNVLHPRDTSPE